MIPAPDALRTLQEGNRRFKTGIRRYKSKLSPTERVRMAEGQQPLAVVLGCSDSRVPVETIFDQGPGDLFVVRVAGNVVAPTQRASVEFAVEKFQTRLVVVLGHTHCGAIQATLSYLNLPPEERTGDPGPLISRIGPTLEPLALADPGEIDEAHFRQAVRANVAASVKSLKKQSALLIDLVDRDEVQIVGAEYDIETGGVTFLYS